MDGSTIKWGLGWYKGRAEGKEEFSAQCRIQTCNVTELDCRIRRKFPRKLSKGFGPLFLRHFGHKRKMAGSPKTGFLKTSSRLQLMD